MAFGMIKPKAKGNPFAKMAAHEKVEKSEKGEKPAFEKKEQAAGIEMGKKGGGKPNPFAGKDKVAKVAKANPFAKK